MPGWGLGNALKNLSTRIFTEDLANELEPPPRQPHYQQDVRPQKIQTSYENTRISQEDQPPPASHAHEHVRQQLPEHQPSQSDAEQNDLLQQKMKNLMKNPPLWALYKERLAQTENPSDPQMVRTVLLDFLEEHRHEIRPPPKEPPARSSLFQTLNASIAGITVAGLEEESTHVRKSMQAPPQVPPEGGRDEEEEPEEDYDNLTAEEMQEKMKQAMKRPKLWTMYKQQLSREPNKRHPETVRRVFIDFLKKHGDKLQDPPVAKKTTPKAPAKSSAAPAPKPSSSNKSSQSTRASIFQNLNMSFMEESTHIRHFPDEDSDDDEAERQRLAKEEKQRKMHLLRSHPTLYPQFQEELQVTDSNDFVTEFLNSHEKELDAFQRQQEEERHKQEERKREKVRKESVFQSLNMSMHEESMHFDVLVTPDDVTTGSPVRGHKRPSLLSQRKPASNPRSMYGRESLTSRSARNLKVAMDALGGELDDSSRRASETKKNPEEFRPDSPNKRASDTRLMYTRESLTSRSARNLKVAMDALGGELDDSPRRASLDNKEREQFRPSLTKSYPRGSISSRSARNLKIAMDALAGEVDETTVGPKRALGTTTDGAVPPKPLPATARTVWIETGQASSTSSTESPPVTKEVTTSANSPFSNILTWSPQIPSMSGSKKRNAKGVAGSDDVLLSPRELHEIDLVGDGAAGSGASEFTSPRGSIRASLRKVSTIFAQEMESLTLNLESEVSGHSRRAQTMEDLHVSKPTSNNTFHGPLHNSCPIHFEPAVEDDDWMLNEAADIALRRRRNKEKASTLESIIDNEEDEDEASTRTPAKKDDSPMAASLYDPMMQVTVHDDSLASQQTNPLHPSGGESLDDELGVTMHYDDLPVPGPVAGPAPTFDEINEENQAEVDADDAAPAENGSVEIALHVDNVKEGGNGLDTSTNDVDSDEGSLI